MIANELKTVSGKNKIKQIPIGRVADVDEVANTVNFLCSDESGVMSGSIVDYDQSVSGWHSYSVYDATKIDDSLLGE